jgi:hypothetical protein
MSRPKTAGVCLASALAALLAGTAIWMVGARGARSRSPQREAAISDRAFRQSYLDAAQGIQSAPRTGCQTCHSGADDGALKKPGFLAGRAHISREAWAAVIPLQAKCGACHSTPDPANLPRASWSEVMERMGQLMELRKFPKPTRDESLDILHYYLTFSREDQLPLGGDAAPEESPVAFAGSAFGDPMSADSREHPLIGHVQAADLDRDGHPGVLVCDTKNSAVKWIHRKGDGWREELLAAAPNPVHTALIPAEKGGGWDILVACLGAMGPTEDPVGSVVRLVNDGTGRFTSHTILDNIPRVADAEPGDFNGDGNIDFVIAAYGFINQGEVGWLEALSGGTYRYHLIAKKAGAIHVPTADLDGDGRLDFIALFAQEHEEIVAFLNRGEAGFEPHLLFRAGTPSYGSSGIQLVDLDDDGDIDILFTNGDNLDLPTRTPRSFHGVQWLENKGNLNFVWHDIHRMYGAYCAVAGDLNKDGHLDIVLTSLFNDWSDPNRASLIWLENDGSQRFTPHTIATRPTHLISAAVADLDGDGWPDIVTSGMHGFPPFDRMGRVTLWTNRHARK